MSPAARLSLPSRRNASVSVGLAPNQFRVQGWDPVLIISQIVAFQAIHYLTLALILPLFLSLVASPDLLAYEGGSSSISLAMDWRAFTGRTVSGIPTGRILRQSGLVNLDVAARRITKDTIATVNVEDFAKGVVRLVEWDSMRGWAVAFAWMLTSFVDILYLFHFVRRPTHILDFSLTLLFNHTILTTYYSHAFPSSLFYWFVLGISVVAQIVTAEQLCVKREMREGFQVADLTPHLGGTIPLPGVGVGGLGLGHGRTQSVGVPRDRFLAAMEMGNVGKNASASSSSSSGSGGNGAEYERLPSQDRKE
ncbi:hypothetical protein JCM11491_007170 [Sporobolomyces phaffii]